MRRRISRLAFVTDAPSFGGAERYILSMAGCAQRHGIQPHIHWMPPHGSDESVFSRERIKDISVTALSPEATSTLSGVIRSFRAMMRQFQPDALIVNACGRPRFWVIPWLARHAGIGCVWVHHMVDTTSRSGATPRLFGGRMEGLGLWRWPQTIRHRLASVGADQTVVSNEEDARFLSRVMGIKRDRITIVSPGIETCHYHRDVSSGQEMRTSWRLNDANAFVVGSAGRCVPDKGMDKVIDATASLRRSGINAYCVIAGDGPERQVLQEQAAALQIERYTRFLSTVDHMPAFYSALDVFALCSGTESFGLVLTEAMACECAVVATATAGSRRQIEHYRHGVLLGERSAESLARALRQLHDQPHTRRALGMSARQRGVDHFDIERTWRETLSLLNKPAGQPSAVRDDSYRLTASVPHLRG